MSRRGSDGTVYSQTVEGPNIIYLRSARGENIGFIEKACVRIGNGFYAVMQPVQLLQGMKRGDVLVFHVTRNYDGTDNFEIVLDNNLYNQIMYKYRTGACQYVN